MPAVKRILEVAEGVSAGENSPGFLNKGLELGSARRCADHPHSRGPAELRSDTARSSATRVSNPLVLGQGANNVMWPSGSNERYLRS